MRWQSVAPAARLDEALEALGLVISQAHASLQQVTPALANAVVLYGPLLH